MRSFQSIALVKLSWLIVLMGSSSMLDKAGKYALHPLGGRGNHTCRNEDGK